MALTIGDNFSYMGAKPLDGRLKYENVASMAAMVDSVLYDGCLAYCMATGKTYQWKSTNEVDVTLGRWREFETGEEITIDDQIDDTSENPVQNKVIAEALADKADLVDGKVPAAQLPSYVDDVLEYEDQTHFPVSGESGKIYVALDTNKTYRWSGSAYVEISESLALGETSSTAYRGDRGKTAYDDSQANKAAIGDLSELETEDQGDLVSALNEVKGDIPEEMTAADLQDVKNAFAPDAGAPMRMLNYSTDEQIVGTWIDGKPLYQKTVVDTMPNVVTAGTYVTKYVTLDLVDIDSIFLVNAFCVDENNFARPMPYTLNNGNQSKISVNKTQAQVSSSILEHKNKPLYFTIQYTKTTD